MTTFQVIIDSILRVISGIIPFSYEWGNQIAEHFLQFKAKPELDYLVTLILCIVFFAYFRFDWLGLFSALIRTLTQPTSLKKENRTLDQEVLIFLSAISVPVAILRSFVAPMISENESLQSPLLFGGLFFIAAGLLRFSYRWNKRIKGLNHLRTLDSVPIILISILSIHPAFPLPLVFWVGLAITNYHYEAVFKYSMLLMGVQTLVHFFHLTGNVGFAMAMDAVGRLNGVAALVVMFSIAWWMIMENLQKTLGENTFKSYQWFNIFAALGSFAFHFLKG